MNKDINAIDIVRQMVADGQISQDVAEKYFPELEDNDDERIRKALIKLVKQAGEGYENVIDGVSIENAISWLEKQGEHQLVDKVEPKFHEGEWLCENEPNNYARFVQILEIVNVQGKERYRISRDTHNDEDIVVFDFVERYYHKFGIQDAKAGDVLATSAGAFIYNGNNGGGSCLGSYCGIDTLGGFKTGIEHHWTVKKVYPATKEQRDTLMKAMADAGYAFDLENKELKKNEEESENYKQQVMSEMTDLVKDYIIQKPVERGANSDKKVEVSDEYKKGFECGKQYVIKYPQEFNLQPKQEWGEEDIEDELNEWIGCEACPEGINVSPLPKVIKIVDKTARHFYKLCLKKQKPVKWSEEDESMLNDITHNIHFAETHRNVTGSSAMEKEQITWLKSLKDRYTWKPSAEQMEALDDAIAICSERDYETEYRLDNLRQNLKKLREE